MGTSTSASQLAGKLNRTATHLKAAERTAVGQAALAGKGIILANMGTRTLSGVGKRGARLGVRYDLKGGNSPTALLRVTGPAHLLNNPTAAHRIEPRGRTRTASGRARRGAKAITPDGNPRAGANHPGTKGKRFFERSVPQVRKAADPILRRQVSAALRRSF